MITYYAQISLTSFVWCYFTLSLTHMMYVFFFVLIYLVGMGFIILDTHVPCGPPSTYPSQVFTEFCSM